MKTLKNLFGTVGLLLLLLTASAHAQTTTAFSIPNAGIVVSGHWTTFSTYLDGKQGPRIDLVATGTACALRLQSVAGASLSVVVDGGTPTTLTPGALSADTYVTLFSGLVDAAHTLSVSSVGANSVDVQETGAIQVTGTAPALSAPTFIGQQVRIAIPTGTSYIAAPTSLSWLRVEGGYSQSTFSANVNYQSSLQVDALLVFRATCTTLRLWTCQQAQTYRLVIDGADTSQYVSCANTGIWGWVTVGTGLSSGAEHEYGLECVNAQSSWIYEIAVNVGGSINTSSTYPARTQYAYFGDSITECVTGTSNDSSLGWPHLTNVSRATGGNNKGRSGTYLCASLGSTNSGESRTALITALSPAPATVFMMYGANDASAAVSPSTFQTSYTNTLNSLLSGTSYNIVTLGITDNSAGQTSVNSLNAVIPAAIAACSAPTRVRFLSTAGWVSAGNFVAGAHPNAAGNVQVFNHIRSVLWAPLFRSRPSGHRAGSRSPL